MASYSEHYRRQCARKHEIPDEGFCRFMDGVETVVRETIGLNLLDLPNKQFMIMYENGYTIDEVVAEIINGNSDFLIHFSALCF